MQMTAELRHIAAFLAVARLSSFTRAAALLRVSQPALTVQVKQLEDAFGVRLFDRDNRSVALTPAGRELVAPLERIMHDVEAVAGHARDLAGHRRGFVTLAALPSIAAGLLPRAIRVLADRHEGITVRVRDVTAGKIVDLVKSGEADFGIGSVIRPDPGLASQPLLNDRLCAFAPADHPIARKRHITLRALSDSPLILTSPDSSVRQIVERALAHARLAAHVAQEATYMTTAMGMVRAGLGIAVLPESALAGDAGGIRAVAIRTPALRREISILTSVGRSLSPAAQKLIDVLRHVRPRSA
jgi:LysR family transcriptional regulator, carnitine catabolism transcriptional activator